MGDKVSAIKTHERIRRAVRAGSDGPLARMRMRIPHCQDIRLSGDHQGIGRWRRPRHARGAHRCVAVGTHWRDRSPRRSRFFGNDQVYMEKFLEKPRHMNSSVLADNYGNVVHLGERDCSSSAAIRRSSKKLPHLA